MVETSETTRYTLHLPSGVDFDASFWCFDVSADSKKEPLSIGAKTNACDRPVAELHAHAPVRLELKTLQAKEPTVVRLNHPGSYVITPGASPAAQRVLRQPVLLVADLDDTLIGRSEHMDASTEEFSAFWHASRSAGRCKLVYNTGRTLPLYEDVWGRKKHCLPAPDALVCGVGTRVYFPSPNGGWEEDTGWTDSLDEGWNYEQVKEAVEDVITALGKDRIRYRDEVEQHRHKQTVMVEAEAVLQVTGMLQGSLSTRAVQAVIITGAIGPDWRFIDVLPLGAGKGAALEYVRDKLAYSKADTVAAGDSANDCLMLEHSLLSVVVANCVPELREWVYANKPVCKVVVVDEQDAEGAVESGAAAGGSVLLEEDKVIVLASKEGALGVLQGLEVLGFA